MMTKNALAGLAPFAMVALLATPANAQEVDFDNAMQCSAVYTYLSGSVADSDPDDSGVLQEEATRWLVMAIARDPDDGEFAEEELGVVTADFAEQVADLGDDGDAVEALIDENVDQCTAMADANAEEFDAIDVDD